MLNRIQHCALAAMETNGTLTCMSRSVATQLRGLTITLDEAVLEYCCVQSLAPVQERKEQTGESPEEGCSGGWGLEHVAYKEMPRDVHLPSLEIRK